MEKVGEKLTKEENPNEILGKVIITVYNDCFSVEHTAGLSPNEIVGLLIATLEHLGGETEEEATVH